MVEALTAGADDFMVKPIRVAELQARVQRAAAPHLSGAARDGTGLRPLSLHPSHAQPADQRPGDRAEAPRIRAGALPVPQHRPPAVARAPARGRLGRGCVESRSRSLDTHISRLRTKLDLRPANGSLRRYGCSLSHDHMSRRTGAPDQGDIMSRFHLLQPCAGGWCIAAPGVTATGARRLQAIQMIDQNKTASSGTAHDARKRVPQRLRARSQAHAVARQQRTWVASTGRCRRRRPRPGGPVREHRVRDRSPTSRPPAGDLHWQRRSGVPATCCEDPSLEAQVTVAAVIEQDGASCCRSTKAGLRLNTPAGHLDPGESPAEGCARETLEETAHHFTPTALVGIYMARFLATRKT